MPKQNLEEFIDAQISLSRIDASRLIGLEVEIELGGKVVKATIANMILFMYQLKPGAIGQCESITLPLTNAFAHNGDIVDRLSYTLRLLGDKIVLGCKPPQEDPLALGNLIQGGFVVTVGG